MLRTLISHHDDYTEDALEMYVVYRISIFLLSNLAAKAANAKFYFLSFQMLLVRMNAGIPTR